MADENQARHVLAEMQARLARSAYDALDIQSGEVGPAEVRASFLALTKRYHPARFARMAPEIQRLANEVFLGLRAAHDQLARPKSSMRQTTNNIPILPSKTPTTSTSTATTTRIPTGPRPATTPGRPTSAPVTPPRPGVSGRPPPRAPTPAAGVRTVPPAPPPTATTTAEPELAVVYDLLDRGAWDQARAALTALSALAPKPRYRALVHYSKAREAQLAGDRDSARIDLLDALEIDPDLQVAKTALSELFTRRK